jgi:hypothetical protein
MIVAGTDRDTQMVASGQLTQAEADALQSSIVVPLSQTLKLMIWTLPAATPAP